MNQANIWQKAHQSTLLLPPPHGFGWEVNDAGTLEIKWTEGDLVPQELADIIVDTLAGDDEDDEEIPELENGADLILDANKKTAYRCVFTSNAYALLQYQNIEWLFWVVNKIMIWAPCGFLFQIKKAVGNDDDH